MRKLLFLLLILTACNGQRSNGIYQSENGWDIVEDDKTYQYRCEPDGLYLYIDWNGANSYSLDFFYKDNERTFARLKFLCKNKEGKYVYVANYYELNIRFYNLKEIGFDIGDGRMVIHKYRQNKDCFSLLEKYTAQ